MIGPITAAHHTAILRLNEAFVDWLSPLDAEGLSNLLHRAQYARHVGNGQGVLIGYAHDTDYPDHKNLDWLRARVETFFYIDRVIIAETAQGQGLGRHLYDDVESYARQHCYTHLTCEVNTKPNNPGSHAFHLARGFTAIGDEAYPDVGKAVRYYIKQLPPA